MDSQKGETLSNTYCFTEVRTETKAIRRKKHVTGRREFQADGTACAKTLGRDKIAVVVGTDGSLSDTRVRGDGGQ